MRTSYRTHPVLRVIFVLVLAAALFLLGRQRLFSAAAQAAPAEIPQAAPEAAALPMLAELPLFTDEELFLLGELSAAMEQDDAERTGTALLAWWEHLDEHPPFFRLPEGGVALVNGEPVQGFTGTGFAMDGPTRFYYGPLENGVPQGSGRRAAMADRHFLVTPTGNTVRCIQWLWQSGTWRDGVLTGDSVMLFTETPGQRADSRNELTLRCNFNGSPDEVMRTADAELELTALGHFDRLGGLLPHDRFHLEFQIRNGRLDFTEDWLLTSMRRTAQDPWIESRKLSSTEVLYDYFYYYTSIDAYEGQDPWFQNPYPWGGAYRYPHDFMFGLSLKPTYASRLP